MDTEYRIEEWMPRGAGGRDADGWRDSNLGPYVSLMAAQAAVDAFKIQAPYRIVVVVPLTQTI